MKNLGLLVILGVFLILFHSCKSDKGQISIENVSTNNGSSVDDSLLNLKLQEYGQKFRNAESKSEKETWLLEGIAASSNGGKEIFKDVFVKELLKVSPTHKDAADFLWYYANRLLDMAKSDEASLVFMGFKNRYPSDFKVNDAEKYIKSEQRDLHKYMNQKFLELKDLKQDTSGTSKQKSFISLTESFCLAYPNDIKCPQFLISAAEIAGKSGDVSGMVSCFDWVSQYYTQSKEAPMALFLKAFYFDNHFNNKEEAGKNYSIFLEKYPSHQLTKDAKYLLKAISEANSGDKTTQ